MGRFKKAFKDVSLVTSMKYVRKVGYYTEKVEDHLLREATPASSLP